MAQLEVKLQKYIFDCASNIRKVYLGMVRRKMYQKLKKATLKLQPMIRGHLARVKYNKLRRDRAARKIQVFFFFSFTHFFLFT